MSLISNSYIGDVSNERHLEKTRKQCILHTYEGAIVSGPALPDGILQLKLTLKCEELFGEQCHLALLCAYGRAFVKTE